MDTQSVLLHAAAPAVKSGFITVEPQKIISPTADCRFLDELKELHKPKSVSNRMENFLPIPMKRRADPSPLSDHVLSWPNSRPNPCPPRVLARGEAA